jgi:hypothetical protein
LRKYSLALLILAVAALTLTALPAAASPTTPTRPARAADRPTQPAQPAQPGWQRVSYGPVSFEAPGGWPVRDLAAEPGLCARLDLPAVYLGSQGPSAACPAHAVGRPQAVQIQPLGAVPQASAAATTPTRLDGQPARVDPNAAESGQAVVALDKPGALLTVAKASDAALEPRVLQSVRVSGATRLVPSQPVPNALAATRTTAPKTYTGKGFDACTAPSTRSMSAWRSSPYRAVGIYLGGANRACGDGNLSSSWVSSVVGSGWRLIPIYVGRQAPCATQRNLVHINSSIATTQGERAAIDAATRASHFRLAHGSPIYFDMEGYGRSSSCVRTVLKFLSGWTTRLHQHGYRSGVYSSTSSGITDLVKVYNSRTIHRPDYIWFAHWTGKATTRDPVLPSTAWPSHRRIGQYRGGHDERYGAVTINIDNDQVDSLVVGLG